MTVDDNIRRLAEAARIVHSHNLTGVVFHRLDDAWAGDYNGKHFYFGSMKAGKVYKVMSILHPEIRVGFNAADLGPYVHVIAGGPVFWMKTLAELHAPEIF